MEPRGVEQNSKVLEERTVTQSCQSKKVSFQNAGETKTSLNKRNLRESIFSTLSSVAQSCPTLCDPMDCSMPGLPVHHQLPEVAQTHVHRVSEVIQPSHPLLSPSPPAFNLSQHQGLFQWVSSYIMWPKYWSFSISPSNEYSELISFRMDWFDLLAVEGTLKCLLQHP